ncbi:MAG: adenine nucleotide alpha hydrolase family protein [Desulfovibrio sp.]|nr:adenine nucleotide alpha hydrolase family protein [Desulfovibrio sp.]
MKCKICKATAVVALKSHNAGFCAACYKEFFARQVARGIEGQKLFSRSDRVLVALSGGKDSLALMLELSRQGYDVTGLHIDLGIPGSSVAARGVVERFCAVHGLRLMVRDMTAEGLPIPLVKQRLNRPVCSACGKIKRHFFNKVALEEGFDALATGHNLDDEVARLFSNTLRWDTAYLSDQGPLLDGEQGFARKVKPLWRLTEFETANYAFLMGIEHHYAPCPYSPGASFTTLKGLMQRLEAAMPGRKLDFYQGFLKRGRPVFARRETEEGQPLAPCTDCGYPTSSGDLCGVCRIREALRDGSSA